MHAFDLVAKEFKTNGPLVVVGRNDFHHVAPDAECAAVKVVFIPFVLNFQPDV